MAKPTIERPAESDLDTLAKVWEASVRSSHHFLAEEDIRYYMSLVRNVYFPAVELYIIRDEEGSPAAFMGLSDDKVEMLFVRTDRQGRGYGTQLLEFALHEKSIRKVDVNEQNTSACAFYLGKGFRVAGRDEFDPEGRPFPILHLEYGRSV